MEKKSKEGTLKIHSENILPIIKKWLYTDKNIFVRELVSNAQDAITKLMHLDSVPEPRIDIILNKKARTLTFKDNGIGMTEEEVETYITQVAFSGAEEFVQKYQKKDAIIGHFGLGFYSSFMVAEKVDIQTLSFQEGALPVFWTSDGSINYRLEEGSKTERGTEIILTLSEEEQEFLEEANLRKILEHFCSFLPYPIFFNDSRINEQPPLWIKQPSECSDKEYLEFYQTLFPFEEEPLFWVHLNVDVPFNLKGVLYFPKLRKEQDFSRRSIQLYCNRVFVSDNCQEILPDYLMLLKGCLDSPDVPLNVSRSALQTDRTIKQLGQHIAKKIADRLTSLHTHEKERFLSLWPEIEMIIKYGALQEEKFFDKVRSLLLWKTIDQEWKTAEEVSELTGKKEIFYTQDEKSNTAILQLYREKKVPVLLISPHLIDQSMIQLLENKLKMQFKRIDANLEEHLLDPSKEKSLLDAEGKTESGRLADLFRKKLKNHPCEVEAKSLASSELFGFVKLEESQRRMRDYFTRQGQSQMSQSCKPTFVINTNNKLIHAIAKVEQKDPELAQDLALQLYDLALLSQKEISPEAISSFITRSSKVLEALTIKATETIKATDPIKKIIDD